MINDTDGITILHEWENGDRFYLDRNNEYILLYGGIAHPISIVRAGICNMAISRDGGVPKQILAEIGANV